MVALQEIRAEALCFRELLKLSSGFSIPALQRPYAWQENNVEDFISDTRVLVEFLQEHRNNEIGEHLFGTIVTIGQSGLEQQIVDGQQRLTTVTLALAVLMQAYDELLSRPGLVDEVKDDCRLAIRELQKVLFRDDEKTPRLNPSPTIQKTYLEILNGGSGLDNDERRPAADRLRTARRLIFKELIENTDVINRGLELAGKQKAPGAVGFLIEPLDEYRHYNDIQVVLLERLKLVHVRTSSADASYDLFESLNTRGATLNVLDLVKVWMLARFAGSPDDKELAAAWDRLGTVEEEIQINYLRDFFRARAYKNPSTKDRLGKDSDLEFSKSVRRSLFKEGAVGGPSTPDALNKYILDEVNLMADWQKSWNRLKSFENTQQQIHPFSPIDKSNKTQMAHLSLLEYLLGSGTNLGNKQSIPLLLQSSNRLNRDEFDQVVGMLVRFFFRYLTIGKASPDSVSRLYDECSASVNDSKSKSLTWIVQKLDQAIDATMSDAEFMHRLKSYDVKGKRNKAALWFQVLEMFSKGASVRELDRKAIMLQIEKPTGTEDDETLQLLNGIGNHVLIPGSLVALSKGSFAELKAVVGPRSELASYPLTQKAFQEPVWNHAVMKKRADEIAKQAVKSFHAKLP
jgi:uncharacterized protein with ParB-like and HNH nuclease domain